MFEHCIEASWAERSDAANRRTFNMLTRLTQDPERRVSLRSLVDNRERVVPRIRGKGYRFTA
jgi:hypothetical protein